MMSPVPQDLVNALAADRLRTASRRALATSVRRAAAHRQQRERVRASLLAVPAARAGRS